MAVTWILVADENRARIFAAESVRGEINEVSALVHPELKLREHSMASDGPGRNRSGTAQGSHAVNETGDIRDRHAQMFAKEIAAKLAQGLQRKRYQNLLIVAAPRFLGVLRKELGDAVRKHISLELDKDLTRLSARELRQHLPERLPFN